MWRQGLSRVRRLTDQEGQKLRQIVRRGSTSSVRYRRAMTLLASAGGNRVPVIAQLVQADEDTVRDVIHRFNEFGLIGIRPTAGSGWGHSGHPERHPATCHRTHGVRYFHGGYSIGDDILRGINRREKGIRWGGRPLTTAA